MLPRYGAESGYGIRRSWSQTEGMRGWHLGISSWYDGEGGGIDQFYI